MNNQIKSIIIVGVVIVVLYYIMSPYQNCMRKTTNHGLCLTKTIW